MIRTQISMTEDQAEGLRRLAAVRGRSQAALLREALDHLLGEDERRRRVERVRRSIGAYRSTGGNTAVDHDEALDEAFGA